MPDYGHDLLFGTFITPSAANANGVVQLAQLADDIGLDLVSIQDHPYQPAFLDTWTLLSVITAHTSRIRVTPNVANLLLRPPAMLAKAVASLDILSHGRVELGLGAGAFGEPSVAMGGPRRKPAESVDALEEAIGVIRQLWRAGGPAVRVDGQHYRVWGAKPGPAPAHDVGIWLGAYKRRMLGLTGRLADGWLPSSFYSGPEMLAEMNQLIDDAAAEAGREPAQIRRLYNIGGRFQGSGSEFLQGSPAVWVEQLAELTVTEGMSGYLLATDDADVTRRFAAEVVPAVRELVERERGGGPSGGSPSGGGPSGGSPSGGGPSGGSPSGGGSPPEGPSSPGGSSPSVELPTPTPDDGHRLSAERIWTEEDRPVRPRPDPGQTYTSHGRANGQHLIEVHDQLRAELRQLRELVEQVAAGSTDAHTARSHINTMTMRQNNWTLGAYCESYCRVVTTHHTLEDQTLFPRLRWADPRLKPVIDRLEEEHAAIHDLLERVDRALVSLVDGGHGTEQVRAAVDLLTDTLLSHLSYEERELVEPLARIGTS